MAERLVFAITFTVGRVVRGITYKGAVLKPEDVPMPDEGDVVFLIRAESLTEAEEEVDGMIFDMYN